MPQNKSRYATIDLEAGMPLVEHALKRMHFQLDTHRKTGVTVIKLIHGYGSSGTGGKIRIAVRKELAAMKAAGKIRDYVIGEEFSMFSPVTRQTLVACAQVRGDRDLERHNNGITVVWL